MFSASSGLPHLRVLILISLPFLYLAPLLCKPTAGFFLSVPWVQIRSLDPFLKALTDLCVCMFSNPSSAMENHREPEGERMFLALVLVSWGESKAMPGAQSRCARQVLLHAWWRAEGNAGNDIPEHTSFLQSPLADLHAAYVCSEPLPKLGLASSCAHQTSSGGTVSGYR